MQGSKLYVGNFSYSIVDSQLEELFSQFGQVKSVNVIGNKGFGFVEMSTNEEAEKAKEALDGTEFEGRTLRVDEARPQRSKPPRNFNNRRY
jgi:RNA recognition motif-containing protein